LPRLRRYVAVDETCRDRLVERHALPADRVRVIGNAVDLTRFPLRGWLPAQPRRALVFSNYAAAGNFLDSVRAAGAQAGLQLDVMGSQAGTAEADPGAVLSQYDLIFAKARCALEAMASGAAVILCGAEGAGPLVTTAQFDDLRRWNFGRRALRFPMRPAHLLEQIARYDATDAAAVARRVRTEANTDAMLDVWLQLYGEVIAEQRAAAAAPDWLAESRAAADGVRWLMPYYREITRQGERITELHRLLAQEHRAGQQVHLRWQQSAASWQQQLVQRRQELAQLRMQLAQQQRFTSLCRSLVGRVARKLVKVASFPLRAAGL